MSEAGQKESFWSRPFIRWTATVLLGIVFVLAFVILLTAGQLDCYFRIVSGDTKMRFTSQCAFPRCFALR